MNRKDLRKLTKAELVDLLHMYGDDTASVSMSKNDLIDDLINYNETIHELYPNYDEDMD